MRKEWCRICAGGRSCAEAVSAEDRRLRVRIVRGLEDQRRGGHRGIFRRSSQSELRDYVFVACAIAAVAVAMELWTTFKGEPS